jgi:hypothetical protein
VALRITIYYVVLAVVLVVLTATVPHFVDQLPLGGVGEISDFGSSSIYDLEEALLSADDEEIEDIVTESTRARLARGPAWLQEALSLIYAMTSTLLLMLPVSWAYRAIHLPALSQSYNTVWHWPSAWRESQQAFASDER